MLQQEKKLKKREIYERESGRDGLPRARAPVFKRLALLGVYGEKAQDIAAEIEYVSVPDLAACGACA